MSEKVFVRKECHDVYEYIGHCPICGIEERAPAAHLVDLLCNKCLFDQQMSKIDLSFNNKNSLVGSLITKIDNHRDGMHIVCITREMKEMQIYAYRTSISENYISRTYTRPNVVVAPPENKNWLIEKFRSMLKSW